MKPFGEQSTRRRARNQKALDALGIDAVPVHASALHKTVRDGNTISLFTIGYEKRTGDELMSLLRNAGVQALIDVREKPTSRRADFRESSLRARCENVGIDYHAMTDLGSTQAQRNTLRETGDIDRFQCRFRTYAKKSLNAPLDRLAQLVKESSVALLCYERHHEDCHRSVVADLIADRIDASIIAIL